MFADEWLSFFAVKIFINSLVIFDPVLSKYNRALPAVIHSLTLRESIEQCFLFNVDYGNESIIKTDWIPHTTLNAPFRDTPIFLSL